MSQAWKGGLVAAAAVMIGTVLAAAAPETFTATASVKRGAVMASAPVTITVTRYAPDAEREAAAKAVRQGGTTALKTLLAGKPDVGFIELGEKRTAVTAIRQAAQRTGRRRIPTS